MYLCLGELIELEEDQLILGYHQTVRKQHQKAWDDHNIKKTILEVGDLVLLYDNKFIKN